MSCAQIIDALASARALSDAEKAHVATCPACRALLDADAALANTRHEPLAMNAALQSALASTTPVKPYSVWSRAAFPIAVLAVLFLIAIVRGIESAVPSRSPISYWSLTGVWVVASTSALILLLRRRKNGLPLAAPLLVLVSVVSFVIFEVLVSLVDPMSVPRNEWWSQNVQCFVGGLCFSALMGIAVMRASLHAWVTDPWPAGLIAGVSSAFAGILVLHIRCPLAEPLHLATSHGLVIVVTALISTMIGGRWLAP